jgi:calcium-binding protein CML
MQKDEDNITKAEDYYNSLSTEEKIRLSNIVSYIKGQNHQLNDKEINDFFKKLDVNKNNTISFNDLQNFLSVLGPTSNNYYLYKIMEECESNGENSKEVSIDRIKDSIKGKSQKDKITELKEIFQLFDVDHDNKISSEDIHSVMKSLGETGFTEEMCKTMVNHLKKRDNKHKNENYNDNNNGEDYLTYDDFLEIVKDEADN